MARESNLVTGILIIVGLCAVVSTGLTVRNAVAPSAPLVTELSGPTDPIDRPNWLDFTTGGHRLGNGKAAPTLVVFSDFECPYCKRFAEEGLVALRAEFGDRVGIIFRHLPLPNHRFAKQFAAAAVCADKEGHFERFHDLVFAKQDSIGLKTALEYAAETGISDLDNFASCMSAPETLATIDRDLAIAEELDMVGTPAILLDGRQYRGMLPPARLLELARESFE